MTKSPSANIRLSIILLALACLCSCQSASPRPANPSPSRHSGIDYVYLLTLRKLDGEEMHALEDGRLKELSPAQMRAVEDSFESRRKKLSGEWLEARARNTRK